MNCKPFLSSQVVSTDLDSGENGRITYSISASTAAPGLFAIDTVNGDVTLQGSLDYESQSSYTLTVKAKDNGSPSKEATATLKISVKDINEAPSIACVGGCVYTVSEGKATEHAAKNATDLLFTDLVQLVKPSLMWYFF